MNRRGILGNGLKGLALVSLSGGAPAFLARAASAAPAQGTGKTGGDGPALVVLQLAGGNDGLNTVIPVADDAYYRVRPTLGVKKEEAVRLDDRAALHPSLQPLKVIFDAGQLAIIHGVGYPNPNYSHFRATEIWESGDPAGPAVDGWLGRFYANACNGLGHPIGMAALGSSRVPPMLRGSTFIPPAISSPDEFKLIGGPEGQEKENERRLAAARKTSEAPAKPLTPLDFIQKTVLETHESIRELRELSTVKVDVEFPDSPLGRNLRLVSQMLRKGYPTRVFYISLDGFDTHSGQSGGHANLLKVLADAVSAFHADLQKAGCADRAVLMTFSEFGRRVQQNGNDGTDHGSAAPLFVAGAKVKGGSYGAAPSLTDLVDDGNLKFTTDFRSVYATLLDRWLRADSRKILGGPYPHLEFV